MQVRKIKCKISIDTIDILHFRSFSPANRLRFYYSSLVTIVLMICDYLPLVDEILRNILFVASRFSDVEEDKASARKHEGVGLSMRHLFDAGDNGLLTVLMIFWGLFS